MIAKCGCQYTLEHGIYGSRGEGPISIVVADPYPHNRCEQHRDKPTKFVSYDIARQPK
jgi:hypothetical protein